MNELEEILGSIHYHIAVATQGFVKISDNEKYAHLLRHRASLGRGFLADAERIVQVIERNLPEPPTGEIRPELSE